MDVLFLCKKIYLEPDFVDGGILVSADDGKILAIFKSQTEVNSWMYSNESSEVIDFGELVLMPGLIDSHVHINDPGREDWEGFVTATKAAAAGGFTTIVDMPLNSIPPTTTVENFNKKLKATEEKLFVDVAFWGGLVPGNQNDLKKLVYQGVCGFKCFLCPTGVPEFQHVEEKDLRAALEQLKNVDTVILFHAEIEPKESVTHVGECNPKKYETFLQTKPPSMEVNAIKLITELSKEYKNRFHIVHLSSADALPIIKKARDSGSQITVETCHHYLSLAAEEVPDEHTEYKCCPPIRGLENREKLWSAVIKREIDLVISDHSPCTPGLKCLTYGKNRGDFLKAWGGISSVQFGLSLFWTNGEKYGINIADVVRCLCTEPAKLCGLSNQKGKLEVGYDADFCVWNPSETFSVTPDIIHFQNKATPYMNKVLKGVVHSTIVRGYQVYQQYENFTTPFGKIIRPKRETTKN